MSKWDFQFYQGWQNAFILHFSECSLFPPIKGPGPPTSQRNNSLASTLLHTHSICVWVRLEMEELQGQSNTGKPPCCLIKGLAKERPLPLRAQTHHTSTPRICISPLYFKFCFHMKHDNIFYQKGLLKHRKAPCPEHSRLEHIIWV